MFDTELHISILIAAHLQGRITEAEQEQLDLWLLDPENKHHFDNAYQEHVLNENLKIYHSANKESVWLKTIAKINADKDHVNEALVKKLYPFRRIAIAAAIVLILFGAGLFYFNKGLESSYSNDIAPGKQGATLTLANGSKIRLSNAANGEIAKEAGISVTKSADGQLVYKITSSQNTSGNTNTNPAYNTLSTAKGETYQVHLPDGSLVYLNAASSLTYSAALIDQGKRTVKLQGEGYFEVAKDKKHPFVVQTDKQKVEVLGTHFNINSYADEESTKTTLLEGVVRVSSLTTQPVTLKPNQQAILTGAKKIKVEAADADEVMAWQKGYFQFSNQDLESIMRQVSRWYNVTVVYENEIDKTATFSGTVSKYDYVGKVLRRLELTGAVKFKIEGRKVIVARQ